MRTRRILAQVFVILAALSAQAAPQLDPAVSFFLQEDRRQIQLPVMIVYEHEASLLDSTPANRVESTLREFTKKNESRVFTSTLRASKQRRKTLWLAGGTLVRLTQSQIRKLAKDPSISAIHFTGRNAHIIEDKTERQDLGTSLSYTYGLEKIGVEQIRKAWPDLDGRGVRVGILDTGIDPNHPDLHGKIKLFKDFTSAKNPQARDEHGHGTHVAGTVAGGNASGVAIGVAPRAELIIAKGFDQRGASIDEDLLIALQWMADPDGDPNTDDAPRLISNSWNTDGEISQMEPSDAPFCVIAENLARMGIAPVFAAGNDGPRGNTIKIPGACPSAITVGATDSVDLSASFTSVGPAKWKSATHMKPDISAPGVSIFSAQPGGGYRKRSGTSMATPHAAGALALLYQHSDGITVALAKASLMNASDDLGRPGLDPIYGAGRLNLFKMISSTPEK